MDTQDLVAFVAQPHLTLPFLSDALLGIAFILGSAVNLHDEPPIKEEVGANELCSGNQLALEFEMLKPAYLCIQQPKSRLRL